LLAQVSNRYRYTSARIQKICGGCESA